MCACVLARSLACLPACVPACVHVIIRVQLTSVKLCELYTERIKQVQPTINAMAQDRFKEALEEARKIDQLLASFRSGKPENEFTTDQLEMLRSPLLGVPISVKESIMVKGMRNSCGLWDRRNSMANYDSVVVSNVQRFGMIPICTTNIPECTLYWADCQNKVYGRSLNPYDLSRITGASSGGEGSLLSSGGSLIGIGSDIGGSLRIPAHYCGIYSHKPSPFLVSAEGNYPELLESRLRLFTLGPMCRYASDLRPLLKCLMSDKDNSKQDTYYKYQPQNIATIRKQLLQRLDEPIDLSQVKFYYCNFNESELKGKQSVRVQTEILEAQQELIDHFRSKFACQVEQINIDKYLKKVLFTWQCMLRAGGTVDRDSHYKEDELKETFGIDSMTMEFIKMPFGLSKHTKESLLALIVGTAVPKDRSKAFPLCEKFEKFASELRQEIEQQLGDNGVLIIPTLPTVAYKHNVSLLKMADLRFPALFNILQMPASHATMRLDKKHKLPFGFSVAAKLYNDPLTLAVAEEVELAFGGWVQPTSLPSTTELASTKKVASPTEDAKQPPTTTTATNRNNNTELCC